MHHFRLLWSLDKIKYSLDTNLLSSNPIAELPWLMNSHITDEFKQYKSIGDMA
jgi:hypothetical protein